MFLLRAAGVDTSWHIISNGHFPEVAGVKQCSGSEGDAKFLGPSDPI
jgi:hypothetical protein